MEKNQANMIADAILQPHVAQQKVLHDKQQAALRARQRHRELGRFTAWCGMVGFVVGGSIGYVTGFPMARSAVIVGLAFALIGRLCKWLKARHLI